MFAQITSREYIISQIEVLGEGKILIDTLKKAYNAKKQLIIENDNIFFRYDSTGKLTEKIICLDEDCEKIMTWQYEYLQDKTLIRQYRNGEIQQTQELQTFRKHNISKATDSSFVFLEQEHFWQEKVLKESKYRFQNNSDKKTDFLDQKYQYDSLGRLIQLIRTPDKDSTNCVKIAFQYNQDGKVIKSLHSRFMPFGGDIKHHTDHYKTYTYNTAGQLAEVRTFSQRKAENKLFSITRYFYLQN
ncbi:MAG: hypothetical protein ACK40K_08180 [Raineya sp.]